MFPQQMESIPQELNHKLFFSKVKTMKGIALVTGGAKGIGKAIVERLASDGYDVVINWLTSEVQAEQLQAYITDTYHVRCMAICCDVADEIQVDEMVNTVEREMGYVDVLVNNAAVDLSDLFYVKTVESFRRTLDVNVIGAYNCARRIGSRMKERGKGHIINISSTNGINTYYPMSIDYDASKAALNSLTHNLAVQFAPDVHVNGIAPGFIGTESELDGYEDAFLKQECEKILVKRYGKPEEVASLVSFLISEQADFINNTIIRIDGGQIGSI